MVIYNRIVDDFSFEVELRLISQVVLYFTFHANDFIGLYNKLMFN